jgi:hypothetical protein
VRSFVEQQNGTGSAAAAQAMLDLLTGVAAHAAAHPTVAAFGLAAGMLREADAQAGDASEEASDAFDAGGCSLLSSDGNDSTASQPHLASAGAFNSMRLGGGAAGCDGQGSAPHRLELDPSFWQPQAGGSARHQAALQLLYGASSTAFTRLPFDALQLVQQRRPDAADSCNSHSAQAVAVSQDNEPAQQQQQHQQQQPTAGVPLCLPQLRPPRPLRDWAALVHPSAAGVLSELLAMPGMEAALEALTSPSFLQQLQVQRLALPWLTLFGNQWHEVT